MVAVFRKRHNSAFRWLAVSPCLLGGGGGGGFQKTPYLGSSLVGSLTLLLGEVGGTRRHVDQADQESLSQRFWLPARYHCPLFFSGAICF